MASSEFVDIDTKEICLMCYHPCVKGDGSETLISNSSSSLTGFKQLLRYLNVNTKELFNCSIQFLQWMEIKNEIDVQITLCGKCSLVMEEFDKLYKQYELIQFQFDKCVASLHQSMKSGDESDERVREFKKQMRPNKSVDLINASIAVNLRTQTFNKCNLKLQNIVPRVAVQNVLPRVSVQTAKKESPHNGNPSSSTLDNDDHEENGIQIISVASKHTANNQLQNPFAKDEENADSHSQLNEVNVSEPEEFVDSLLEIAMNAPADEIPIYIPPQNATALPPSVLSTRSHLHKLKLRRKLASKKISSLACDICPLTFRNRKTLRRHRVFVHSETVLSKSCPIDLPLAQFKLKLNSVLQRLYEFSVRNDESDELQHCHYCRYCQSSFKHKADYKYHLVAQHPNELVSEVNQSCSSEGVDKPLTKFRQRKRSAVGPSTSRSENVHCKSFSCKFCQYRSTTSNNIRYHSLDVHTEEMVLPHLNTGACKIKCRQATEALLIGLRNMEGQCPKCSTKMTRKSGLRRHILGQHFGEFVQEVKDFMSLDGDEIGENMGDEEYQEEIPVEIEFGTENVKVELMATADRWDPLELDMDFSN